MVPSGGAHPCRSGPLECGLLCSPAKPRPWGCSGKPDTSHLGWPGPRHRRPSPGPMGCKGTGPISTGGGDEMCFFWLDASPRARPSDRRKEDVSLLEGGMNRAELRSTSSNLPGSSVSISLRSNRRGQSPAHSRQRRGSPYSTPGPALAPQSSCCPRLAGRPLSGPGRRASPSPGRWHLACACCPVPLSGTLLICVFIYQQHILNCIFMAQCTFHS